MKKFYATFALSLLACQTSFAANFYGGLNLGVNTVKVNKNLYYPLDDNPVSKFKFNSSYNGFHGQLFLGAEVDFSSPFGLALQADTDLYTGATRNSISNWFLDTTASTKEKLTYGFGLFALPEYQLNNRSRLFFGPGIVFSQFSTQSGYTAGNLGVTGNFNPWLTGWAIKFGSINQITNNVDLLLTYQYEEFDTFHRANSEPLSLNLLGANYRPYANFFSIGLRYVTDRQPAVYEK